MWAIGRILWFISPGQGTLHLWEGGFTREVEHLPGILGPEHLLEEGLQSVGTDLGMDRVDRVPISIVELHCHHSAGGPILEGGRCSIPVLPPFNLQFIPCPLIVTGILSTRKTISSSVTDSIKGGILGGVRNGVNWWWFRYQHIFFKIWSVPWSCKDVQRYSRPSLQIGLLRSIPTEVILFRR